MIELSAAVKNDLPRIAVSLGDPGGVGPEVALMAVHNAEIQSMCTPVLVGDAAVIEQAARVTGLMTDSVIWREPIDSPRGNYLTGQVHAANGAFAYTAVCTAAKMVLNGEAVAMCTAPLNKEAMFEAGYDFPGHTELLAHLCGDLPVRMMLEGGGVRVVLETIHVGLASVSSMLRIDGIVDTLQMCDAWGQMFMGIAHPRIAVCGFNPHAGEGGKFGKEEIVVIAPAVRQAVQKGICACGPLSADTIFHRQIQGDFDIVLAMYHDQGLVAVKTVGFDDGVNITMGLPIIRTSPDHGTAFDIAGTGKANPASMICALKRAAQFASVRAKQVRA
ncbi:4-hydroxythreonine-4-phosphate dehydrogenase PdxA [Candidatus Sumerlaeota bacterium]|nr:4-hydroxythreonine-4-phosphate dehydrogenase PdxA [Candidatus Sumerlaeota bacterium]